MELRVPLEESQAPLVESRALVRGPEVPVPNRVALLFPLLVQLKGLISPPGSKSKLPW